MATGVVREVPGIDGDLARLVALYERMVVEDRGQVVFVAGDEGSGRSALLHWLTDELARVEPRATVLAGGFQDARYVAWDEQTLAPRVSALVDRTISIGEPAATLAGNFLPLAGLLGQALSASKAALDLAQTMVGDHETPDLSVLMPRVLRGLCEDGPVVCIADDADQAPGGWWADLVLLFARHIARDLPLLLILAVDGPPQLGVHDEDEPDALFVARALTREGLACWHPLTRVTAEELQRWTGPAMPEVVRELLEVTGGRADWTAQLWRDWQRRRVIDQTTDDLRWRFVAGRERAMDEVEDLLGARLKVLIGTDDLNALELARRLLCCAALEGSQFTADAIALALGRGRDEVIDNLDDTLVWDEERPVGLVIDAGSLAASDETGERCLWRYRFRAKLDWLTLRHHGLTDGERHYLSLALARAMQTLYGGEARRVAMTLARLYETAGHVDEARYYRHMGEIRVSREVALWRARNVLSSPDPEQRFERRRASRILLAAAHALFHSGPFDDGLDFASTAHRLADQQRDQALALYSSGAARIHLGDIPLARRDLDRARELYRELGKRRGEVHTRHELARIDSMQGDYEKARTEFLAVLEMCRELGDRPVEVHSRHELARIDSMQGEYEKARTEFLAVLGMWRELGDRHGEVHARRELACIDSKQGEYEKARTEFLAVLGMWRELGDRHGEAYSRRQLARIDSMQGEHEKARTEFLAVLEMCRELGDRHGEAHTRYELARIDSKQGEHEKARTEFLAVLNMCRELGDRPAEAHTRRQLARIDSMQGEHEKARTEFLAVLEMDRELGDRHGEAHTRYELARIDSMQGEHEKARTAFLAVLEMFRELGDRPAEAHTRHDLANIDLIHGEYEKARTECLAVLELRRDLGDRHGEAATLATIARIDEAALG
jgi:tetratricopeptide (TPR) repeat protein